MNYLAGYPEATLAQVRSLIAQERLGDWLLDRYPDGHGIRTDRALYDYVMELKNTFLRSSSPLSKIVYDSKLQVVQHALGTHTTVSRVQGSKLKAKREIRVAAQLRETPLEFLRMIAVHELAHLKERDHDKAFYQLCARMEPQYHQYEFHLRLYLTHLDAGGQPAWR
ncbi:M48 metallopeptidase family protein [Caenimonas soli]|uniref:M48 metallopeptidase family protein n=1 Tax=Caenimonas soli TaxID=2735555 RepID=UPI001553E88A|nr:M48 family metallopeptidase [Caenimonas soli]NPC56205.1 M48 family metallopeptidase [Caenimonas soli]